MSLGSILSLIPVPRRLPLGGRDHLVSEMTLRDLADLEAFADARRPDALQGVAEAVAGADPAAREKILARAYLVEWKREGATYGGDEARAFYATDEGVCLLLWVALRKHRPGITAEECVEVAGAMSPAEFDRFTRVFHGTDTLKALERLLWGPDAPDAAGAPTTWTKAIVEVALEWGQPLENVYALTLTEFGAMRRRGEARERGRTLRPGEDPEAAMAEFRRLFGEIE